MMRSAASAWRCCSVGDRDALHRGRSRSLNFSLLGFGFYMLHARIQIYATELAPQPRAARRWRCTRSSSFSAGDRPGDLRARPSHRIGAAASLLVVGAVVLVGVRLDLRAMCGAPRADLPPSRGRDRARRPGPAPRRPSAGSPVCQNTSIGMPPRGYQ